MKKLFVNDRFYLAMVLCAVIGNVLDTIIFAVVVNEFPISKVQLLIRVVCLIALYISYRKHSKNVMKGLMGALLMAQLLTAIGLLSNMNFPIDIICVPVFAVLSLLLLINHFVINSDHHSSPVMVRINQILGILLVVNEIIWAGNLVITMYSTFILALQIANVIGCIGMVLSIICVESRLDAYRIDREVAGWTEEKGYPEGYVHEYEKKENK